MVICLGRGADLRMAQLMSLPLTISCFSRIQIVFAFLVLAHMGNPGQSQRAIIRVCVCVCVRADDFWPTVLSVEPMVQYVVCLSVVCRLSVCDVLYCGETVRPSKKVSEGVNRKPGSKN